MPLKIQLINSTQGIENVNPDPEGLNEFELELKRSADNDGIFFEFGVDLKFFKGSRKFIRDVYEREGIEGVIQINIFEYLPNEYKFTEKPIYSGQIRLKDYEIDEIGVSVNVEQKGLERSFLNKTKIDRTIGPSHNITVPAKTILKRFEGEPTSNVTFRQMSAASFYFNSNGGGQFRSATRYFMIEVGNREFDEVNSVNEKGTNYAISEIDPVPFMTVLPDEQGLSTIELILRNAFSVDSRLVLGTDVDVGASPTTTPPVILKCFFEHRDKFNQVIEKTQLGSTYDSVAAGDFGTNDIYIPFDTRVYTGENKLLSEGDQLFIYYEMSFESPDFNVNGSPCTVDYDLAINADVGGTFDAWRVRVTLKTQFPATETQSVLPFEFFDQLVRVNTKGLASLKSEFLGRTEQGYSSDGPGSLLAITNGHKLRLSNTKKIFANWIDAFETFSALYCLGWGFETDNLGNNFIRIEKKEYFYDKTAITISLNSVADLRKSARQDLYYSQVECAYPKFENIDTANSVDEFNTVRRYASDISQADNSLKLLSKYRASSFEIESQRRQALGTEDSKLDDEMFLIALKRISGGLAVETGADYASITGVFDAGTTFNIRLRPSLMIQNWAPVLSSSLFRSLNKSFDFTYGEKNYTFSVDGESEDRDISFVNADALWLCDQIEFSTGFTATERALLRANPRALIVVKDWKGNKVAGYLSSAKTILEENKADFTLLRANVNLDEIIS